MPSHFNLDIINKKDVWENFFKEVEKKSFLQSWNWGEFHKKMGETNWRFGIFKDGAMIGICQVVKQIAKRGSFLAITHGPVIKNFENLDFDEKYEILDFLFGRIKDLGRQGGVDFIRVGSIFQRSEDNKKVFQKLGFRNAPIFLNAEETWVLDISFDEKDLLKNMEKRTRYSIKRGQREGVIIEKSNNLQDLDKFYRIYQKTIQRKNFASYPLNYLKKEFESFLVDDEILIFFAKVKNEIVSSAIIIFWQNVAVYHHGASLRKYSNFCASEVLQWEAIKEARERGMKYYNFWGVAPENQKNHPWQGFTFFKKGFGGTREKYLKTQDLVLTLKYWPCFLFETLRRKKRYGY